MMTTTPVADWVDLRELSVDPYRVFARLRQESPVAWVPSLNRFLLARFEHNSFVETRDDLFEPDRAGSLMRRSIGANMLSKGEPEHARERRVINPSLRPRAIKQS